MIGAIRGILIDKRPEAVIIEAGGVGYEIIVPVGTLTGLPELGREVFLHIHTSVREDAIKLYGFSGRREKEVFNSLISVTGIGPKMAVNILSGISHEAFVKAVETEDMDLLVRIPGLGRKTANRLILELKGKLPDREEPRDRAYSDTLSALVNLGYRKQDASQALDAAYKRGSRNIEELLKESLKILTGRA